MNLFLWGSTFFLAVAIGVGRWFLKREPISPPAILFALFQMGIITLLTQQALAVEKTLPVIDTIRTLPGLTPLYLILHYFLIIRLVLGKLLPFHPAAIWLALFLYPSYLYFRNFFALEQGAFYPLIYALVLVLLLSSSFRPRSISSTLALRPGLALAAFLLLAGAATALSAAPAESLSQYFQILCFALLPFLLVRYLSSEQSWRTGAIWLITAGGAVWVVLAGIKFGLLAANVGLYPALRHRLFIADVGPNWLSLPLVALLPLSISFLLTASRRWQKLGWGLASFGMLLTIAYTQSLSGYSGWVGLILGLGSLVLLLKQEAVVNWWQRHPGTRLPAVSVGLGLLVSLGLTGAWLAAKINPLSLYTRLYGWGVLFYQLADQPWFGAGPGVRHITAQYGDRLSWGDVGASASWLAEAPLNQSLQQLQLTYHTHNLFLELAIGAGLPALLAFLWFLWELAWYGLATLRRSSGSARVLISGCMAGIVGALSWGFIDVMEFSPPFFTFPTWALIGFLLAAPHAFNVNPEKWPGNGAWLQRVPTLRSIPYLSFIGSPGWQGYLLRFALLAIPAFVAIIAPIAGNSHYRAAYTAYQERRWPAAAGELAQAARWEPLNAKYLQLRAEALINLDHYPEASAVYEQALRLKSDFAPYHAQLGWLYWLQGDLKQAAGHFEKAVEMDPREAWRKGLHADLALAYTNSGRFDEALSLFKQTIELDPQLALAPYWIPVQGAAGQFDLILDPVYLEKEVDHSPLRTRILTHLGKADYTPRLFIPAPDADSPLSFSQVLGAVEEDYLRAQMEPTQAGSQLLASLAAAAGAAGLQERAEMAYLGFLQAYPDSAYGYRELANLYQALGRLKEAQRMAEQATQVDPEDTLSWLGLSQLYLDNALEHEAQQALVVVYRLNPLHTRRYELQARLYGQQQEPVQAAETLRQSLFIRESLPNRLALADLYYEIGDAQQALDQCLQAAGTTSRLWPRPLAPELWQIGTCLAELHIDYAGTDLLPGQDPVLYHLLLGHTYWQQEQLDKALNAYRRAVEARPDEGALHYFLGNIYQALGQPAAAANEYRQAASLYRFESRPLLALGRMQWARGERETALLSFRAATAATPGWGQMHMVLGNALLAIGDRHGAALHFQQAQRLDGGIRENNLFDFSGQLATADIEAPGAEYIQNDYFTIDGQQRRVLYMHPDSKAHYVVSLPDADSSYARRKVQLVFDVATLPSSWEQPGDGVAFNVQVTTEKGIKQLFSTYIDPKSNQADQHWQSHTVDLSAYAGQTVSLTLETGSGPAGNNQFDWAGWGEPRLVLANADRTQETTLLPEE